MNDKTQALTRDLALFLDALYYSFQMVQFQKDEVYKLLPTLEETESIEGEYESLAIRLTLNLWGLIDNGHRIRELIQQVPGLKKSTPEIQVFLRSTKSVEDLRHYVQHLRTGISALPEKSSPLWGVISWVSEKRKDTCFTLLTGAAPDVSVHSCAYDTWNRKYAQELIISVNNTMVEIKCLIKGIEDLNSYIDNWAEDRGYNSKKRRLPIFQLSVLE